MTQLRVFLRVYFRYLLLNEMLRVRSDDLLDYNFQFATKEIGNAAVLV